jgi:hypothetical protein
MAPVDRDVASHHIMVLRHIRHVNFLVSALNSLEYLTTLIQLLMFNDKVLYADLLMRSLKTVLPHFLCSY